MTLIKTTYLLSEVERGYLKCNLSFVQLLQENSAITFGSFIVKIRKIHNFKSSRIDNDAKYYIMSLGTKG